MTEQGPDWKGLTGCPTDMLLALSQVENPQRRLS